jgi:integrase/recombinase XerD
VRTHGAADLGELLTCYIEALRVRQYSASSLEKARFELPRLIQHLRENDVRDASAVTEEHLVAYARHLEQRRTRRGTPLAPASRSSALSTMRRFFTFLASRGHMLRDPAQAIPLPKGARLPRQILSERQARRLVAAPSPASRIGKRDRAILETVYGTGIRLGEAARAELPDLDIREGVLLVRCGKGKKDRVVPVEGRAALALANYLAYSRPALVKRADPALFVSRHGGRLSLVGLRAVVRRHGRTIGVPVSPHALRHTCATHLLRGGADIRHIQQLLGHRCVSTTALYARVTTDDLRRVLARAHPRWSTAPESRRKISRVSKPTPVARQHVVWRPLGPPQDSH